jgi:hypothetical protein
MPAAASSSRGKSASQHAGSDIAGDMIAAGFGSTMGAAPNLRFGTADRGLPRILK